ncbi:hypothetical protein AB0A71_34455 [Kitasatospora aureofaciens]|uniref:hypothetical protein n=1 Tax=Kitasatospora aureofaciens TaxID=1894 RepID=UPI0033ED94D1
MNTNPTSAMAGTEAAPTQNLILPPGYITALDPTTGQVVAVRTQEQPALAAEPQQASEPSLLEKARRYAAAQPDPLPTVPPPAAQGVNPVVGQVVVLGGITSMTLLAAGGAVYLAGAGLHEAGPWFHDAALFLVAAVVVAVVAMRKLKAAATSTRTPDGTVVNALFHKHTEMHIGKQTGGFWKSTVTNNVR